MFHVVSKQSQQHPRAHSSVDGINGCGAERAVSTASNHQREKIKRQMRRNTSPPVRVITAASKPSNPRQAASFIEALGPFSKQTPCPLGGICSTNTVLDVTKTSGYIFRMDFLSTAMKFGFLHRLARLCAAFICSFVCLHAFHGYS